MGGASCKHERLEDVAIVSSSPRHLFWKTEVVDQKCLDCLKQLRQERVVGRLTQHQYSSPQSSCQHLNFGVSESSKQKVREEGGLGGSFLRLFMGPSVDGIQYRWFYMAEATCLRCEFEFYARQEFDRVWKEGKQVDEPCSPWTPMKRKVAKPTTETVEEFVPRAKEEPRVLAPPPSPPRPVPNH